MLCNARGACPNNSRWDADPTETSRENYSGLSSAQLKEKLAYITLYKLYALPVSHIISTRESYPQYP